MALVLGTSCGFVTVAPTSDPQGNGTVSCSNVARALKDTSPAGTNKIIEIGWYQPNTSVEANFEVGLYSHDSGPDYPNARLQVDNTNAKGTGSGWHTVTVDWTISAATIYWIAVQCDTSSGTNIDVQTGVTGRYASRVVTGLQDPFGATSSVDSSLIAIYAKLEVIKTYSELAGTIAAQSGVSGNMVTTSIVTLSGTIAAQSGLSGNLGSTTVGIDIPTSFSKRLVVAGKDSIYYESI